MSRSVMIWVVILCLFGGGMLLYGTWRLSQQQTAGGSSAEGTASFADKPLEEFALVERSGRTFRSSELQGKVWVASFFYASCPGFCFKQNQRVGELVKEFAPQGVQFVSITVDPANDTPSALTTYADRLNAPRDNWLFLTGTQQYIERIGQDIFRVSVERATHSDRLILIGRDGKVVDHFRSTDPADVAELRETIAHLLAEKPSEAGVASESGE
jgi:cytochrome oxidase Cu insertion factor (SCO1/SenC/PrrC family)